MKPILSVFSILAFATCSFGATIVTAGGSPAIPTLPNGLVTSIAGTTTIDFTAGTLTVPTYTEDGVVYSLLGSGSIRNTSAGFCAQPPADNTNYLCVGPNGATGSPVEANFPTLINYFGFYAGSVDAYNTLEFYNGSTLKFSLTGSHIATRAGIAADGNQGVGVYINIFATTVADQFNRIRFISTSNALETDNHAFALLDDSVIPTVDGAIPEPGTLLTLIPAVAFLYFRRKRA